MTVSCVADQSLPNTINCEVSIGPEPEPPVTSQADSGPSSQGAQALVERFPRSASESSLPIPLECLAEVDAVTMALLGATKVAPLLGVLGAFKAGLDLAECGAEKATEVQRAEAHARATDECLENGGTPVGVTQREEDVRELACLVMR